MFTRYAIYLTPRPGRLADFGASWLGWDIARAKATPHPAIDGVDIAAITETPRKYGLHGTIKPPFRLADGMSADALHNAVRQFCQSHAPVTLDGLQLARLGRFLALVPQGDSATLAALAGAAVQELDAFRAPPSASEIERRRRSQLTPAQEANLHKWGYPYVFDCFRFHITLTGPLTTAQLTSVQSALAVQLTPLLPHPFVIDSLTLCGEAENGRFQEIQRFDLSG